LNGRLNSELTVGAMLLDLGGGNDTSKGFDFFILLLGFEG
jgi:hypothetical protein